MTDRLASAFSVLERRGRTAGAAVVASRAIEAAGEASVDHERSHRGRTFAVAACAVAALAAVTVYVGAHTDEIRRVDATAVLGDPDSQPYGPMNVLVVGSDSRAHVASEDRAWFGTSDEVPGERADLVMIVRLDPARRRVAIMSVPRDLLVHYDTSDPPERIADAFSKGTSKFIDAVEHELQIDVDHYVQIDFEGFAELISTVGSVKIHFPQPTRDRLSGLDVPEGCVALDADQALAFVRSRHAEALVDGRWEADPTGDLGRIQRQQHLVRQVLVRGAAAANPIVVTRAVRSIFEHAIVDTGLSTERLLRLARDLRGIPSNDVALLVVPTTAAVRNGAVALEVDPGAFAPVRDALSGPVASLPGEHNASKPPCD